MAGLTPQVEVADGEGLDLNVGPEVGQILAEHFGNSSIPSAVEAARAAGTLVEIARVC